LIFRFGAYLFCILKIALEEKFIKICPTFYNDIIFWLWSRWWSRFLAIMSSVFVDFTFDFITFSAAQAFSISAFAFLKENCK